MTLSERERRIEAIAREVAAVWPSAVRDDDSLVLLLAERFHDAADEAVPVVTEAEHEEITRRYDEVLEGERLRIERVEAATRDFSEAAKDVVKVWHEPPRIDSLADLDSAIDELAIALARHSSFSGEEGTGG